jgi:hypothetical protein
MHEPLETSKCEKCGKIITESKRINENHQKMSRK